jgi:serine O-acetyltransferase
MSFFKHLKEDIGAIMDRDPAARSRREVVFCYPGFHAVLLHRLAHWSWRRGWYLAGRSISQFGRLVTGIEIHPGARIGKRLFIDHGMGCVIGETAVIGDDVTLYHGVTLGGVSLEKAKRHPTLEDGVIVGSGAQILGPITVGTGARVGANAVVLKDVAPGVTMVGIPARQALPRQRGGADAFHAYGTPESVPDPTGKVLDGLLREIENQRLRLEAIENDRGRTSGPTLPQPDQTGSDERPEPVRPRPHD